MGQEGGQGAVVRAPVPAGAVAAGHTCSPPSLRSGHCELLHAGDKTGPPRSQCVEWHLCRFPQCCLDAGMGRASCPGAEGGFPLLFKTLQGSRRGAATLNGLKTVCPKGHGMPLGRGSTSEWAHGSHPWPGRIQPRGRAQAGKWRARVGWRRDPQPRGWPRIRIRPGEGLARRREGQQKGGGHAAEPRRRPGRASRAVASSSPPGTPPGTPVLRGGVRPSCMGACVRPAWGCASSPEGPCPTRGRTPPLPADARPVLQPAFLFNDHREVIEPGRGNACAIKVTGLGVKARYD